MGCRAATGYMVDPVTSDLPTPPIRTTLETSDGVAVLRVEGEIDLLTAPELERALRDGAAAGDTLEADLREVSFIDSTGLRLLLEARDRVTSAGGRLLLRIAQGGAVERLLVLSGVLELFERSEPGGSPS